MKRVSIKDVAKEASVSTATVSHVLNGTRFVAESTTIRVKQAMKKLGYTPNFAAKTLRSQKNVYHRHRPPRYRKSLFHFHC